MKTETAPLPIVGSYQFELTEDDVQNSLKQVQERLRGVMRDLSNPDERIRVASGRLIPELKDQVQALSAPPKDVLARAKTFYDRTIELGLSGKDESSIVDQMNKEFPDLTDFYELLQTRIWGYRLGNQVMAAIGEENELRGKH